MTAFGGGAAYELLLLSNGRLLLLLLLGGEALGPPKRPWSSEKKAKVSQILTYNVIKIRYLAE